jgi:hypothetical protein
MTYTVGQKVSLWGYKVDSDTVTILKEVLVTITNAELHAIGEEIHQCLCGKDADGTMYKKHWDDGWPIDLDQDNGGWSVHDDGDGTRWTPTEAVFVYNQYRSHTIEDADREHITPKGDVESCMEHDIFLFKGEKCPQCSRR